MPALYPIQTDGFDIGSVGARGRTFELFTWRAFVPSGLSVVCLMDHGLAPVATVRHPFGAGNRKGAVQRKEFPAAAGRLRQLSCALSSGECGWCAGLVLGRFAGWDSRGGGFEMRISHQRYSLAPADSDKCAGVWRDHSLRYEACFSKLQFVA